LYALADRLDVPIRFTNRVARYGATGATGRSLGE
jgi:hypothetical protein